MKGIVVGTALIAVAYVAAQAKLGHRVVIDSEDERTQEDADD